MSEQKYVGLDLDSSQAVMGAERKILATMRSMWLSMKPYEDDCLSEPPARKRADIRPSCAR